MCSDFNKLLHLIKYFLLSPGLPLILISDKEWHHFYLFSGSWGCTFLLPLHICVLIQDIQVNFKIPSLKVRKVCHQYRLLIQPELLYPPEIYSLALHLIGLRCLLYLWVCSEFRWQSHTCEVSLDFTKFNLGFHKSCICSGKTGMPPWQIEANLKKYNTYNNWMFQCSVISQWGRQIYIYI